VTHYTSSDDAQKVYPWAKGSALLPDSNGLYGESTRCGHREPLKNAASRANLVFSVQTRLALVFGTCAAIPLLPTTAPASRLPPPLSWAIDFR